MQFLCRNQTIIFNTIILIALVIAYLEIKRALREIEKAELELSNIRQQRQVYGK